MTATPKRPAERRSATTRAKRETRRRRQQRQDGAHELTLRLDADLWAQVGRLCEATDRSASSLIRVAIRHYAEHLEVPAPDGDGTRPIARLREEGLIR